MEIFNSSGLNVAKSGILSQTKPIGSLLISSDVPFSDLANEEIKIQVERQDNNFDITKGFMKLSDFILLTTFDGDAITSDANFALTAICEICNFGSIALGEKDVIKIELSGLNPAKKYVLNGIEEPQDSENVLSFDNKSMSAADRSKIFFVHGVDLALLDNSDDIEEVNYRYENGRVVKYTLHELRALSRSIDPIAYVKQNGTVDSHFASKIQIPLLGVNEIEVRKNGDDIVHLLVRNEI